MLQSFLNLIGIDAANADHVSLHWRHPAWLIAGLVLLPVAAWFIARRHRASLPQISLKARRLLTACRGGVLLLLVLVLGGPYVRMEEAGGRKPVLIVLMDESASMSLKAGPLKENEAQRIAATAGVGASEGGIPQAAAGGARLNEMTRGELMDRAVEVQRDSLFRSLAGDFELRGYRFAQTSRAVDLTKAAAPASEPITEESSLGAAIERAMSDAAGRKIAGIVLFSDGRWTTAPDPIAVMRPRAGAANTTPVFTVPIGSRAAVPDIALLDVLAPRVVAKGDIASISTTIASSEFEGKAAVVRLFDGERELDKATMTLRDNQPQSAQLTLRDTPDAGPRLLRIAVDAAAGERVKQNNARTISVHIDGEKLRLLYLESAPRWDYRFLDHAMRRDKGIDVTVIMEGQLLAAGVKPSDLPAAAKLPVDAAGFAEYSLVILGDISADLLPPALQQALATAVTEMGVGLIVQAGTQSMPQRFAVGPLGDLLPVKVAAASARAATESDEGLIMDGIEAEPFSPFRMRVTAAGATHPAFQLYDSATRSRTAWNAMPEFHWAAATVETTPAATVLAEIAVAGKARPLVVEHFAGRGRVLFIGTDSTYLWRRNVGDALFYRFWGQAIRHVAMRKDRPADAGWIEAQPQRAEPGEPVMIEMYAVDEVGGPRGEAELFISITRDDGPAAPLALMIIGQPGRYRASFVPQHAGSHRLSFDGGKEPISAAFFAAASGREFLRPSVDRDFMSNFADITGGALLELDELPRLATLLPQPVIENVQPVEADVWDHWLTVVLIVGFYCMDVGVRRWAGVA